MTDPIEAAALAMFPEIFNEPESQEKQHRKAGALITARTGIAAYHAAQPSDYAELVKDLRSAEDLMECAAADAIEALEAESRMRQAWALKQVERVEAAEAHAKDQIEAYESLEQEFKELKARLESISRRAEPMLRRLSHYEGNINQPSLELAEVLRAALEEDDD